jgi:hypothetical protein
MCDGCVDEWEMIIQSELLLQHDFDLQLLHDSFQGSIEQVHTLDDNLWKGPRRDSPQKGPLHASTTKEEKLVRDFVMHRDNPKRIRTVWKPKLGPSRSKYNVCKK